MIDTDLASGRLREASIRVGEREILVSVLRGSGQESDITMPVNCEGLGRVHRFISDRTADWPNNPLPGLPAREHLGNKVMPLGRAATAQVFQNAACNWRCWYCYVPFDLLRADPARSRWVTADHLVELYLQLDNRPPILDLSGGQPDLVPEWAVWTLESLVDRSATNGTFLWSDDNLSNDYFFRFLSDDQINLLATHSAYGRVGCLKGYDNTSFSFNTGAAAQLFERQLDLARRLHDAIPKLWLYVTLTGETFPTDAQGVIDRLFDRISDISPDLLARTIPLEIEVFTPVLPRLRERHDRSFDVQRGMMEIWMTTLEGRGVGPPA